MKYILPFVIFFFACASIQPLNGGDKDEAPPKVLNTTPDSASIHVNVNTFKFVFDEYIKTHKVNDLLIISPNQKKNPTLTIKGKSLTIVLNDTLLPNTTYTFKFNGSIVDINETNPIGNYQYLFSTGDYIDSLSHSGTVIDLLTNTPCTECNVQLYKTANDSLILTEKPDYLAKTDELGNYKLTNLPSGTFNKIILKDLNKNLLLDKDEYTTLSLLINTDSTKSDTAYIFPTPNTDKYKPRIIKPLTPGIIKIHLNKPIKTKTIKLYINGDTSEYSISYTKDTISTYSYLTTDTSNILLIIDQDTFKLTYSITPQQLKYKLKITGRKTGTTLLLHSSTPIHKFDSTKLKLYNDSIPITFQTLSITKTAVTLSTSSTIDANIKLYSEEGLITDILNKRTRPDTLLIKNSRHPNSLLTLNINVIDTLETYIVFLKSGKNNIQRHLIKESTIILYKNLQPGNYNVTIITDSNKNDLWDTGNLFLKKTPEKLTISKPFEIRENWDKELTINLL